MPKETVYGDALGAPSQRAQASPTFIGEREDPWRVDVAWGRTGDVQLATLTGEGLGIKTVDPESPDGLWVSLSRDAINRLIRTLRKARDQAFGADE